VSFFTTLARPSPYGAELVMPKKKKQQKTDSVPELPSPNV